MPSLFPLALYCISLVSLQQPLAMATNDAPDSNRLDLLNKLINQREDKASVSESQAHMSMPSLAHRHPAKWLAGFLRHRPASGVRADSPKLAWARPVGTTQIVLRGLRVRRHAHSGPRKGHHYPQHAQLMRVGCVLGTCQVQNLSHRLYQLVGQNGREDSSPINPRSPHSYG
ncbi:protein ADM2a [Spinachia spinachia]